ncbi:MAG: hypothetical protein BAJALOKI1v1_280036 [Promethearchaeota archaeon]|nr:MAG: hypothetical protein BAJALOKI1v1_280036 [Candidatus Lokiarchaeota archaeon]
MHVTHPTLTPSLCGKEILRGIENKERIAGVRVSVFWNPEKILLLNERSQGFLMENSSFPNMSPAA